MHCAARVFLLAKKRAEAQEKQKKINWKERERKNEKRDRKCLLLVWDREPAPQKVHKWEFSITYYLLYLLDIFLVQQQQQLLYRAEKEQKNDPVRELAKKAFEALPGVQSVRARAENDAKNVLLPFYFISFVRILTFKGRKSAFLLGRPAFGLRFWAKKASGDWNGWPKCLETRVSDVKWPDFDFLFYKLLPNFAF